MRSVKFRVRFHLQRGKYYMHWQIRQKDFVQYFQPEKYCIEMTNCKLINKKNIANKVYSSGKKDVCGWVECQNYNVHHTKDIKEYLVNCEKLRYNPIVEPSWRRLGDDGEFDWDNYCFENLITLGNNVLILEENKNSENLL